MIVLEARSATVGYNTAAPLLEGWSASFSAGEVTAITGPSGRGKSTLLYVLGLMLRPLDGEVILSGHSVARGTDAERARLRASKFGFVFQDAALDATRTVLDNVIETALYRGDTRASVKGRAIELLDRFGVGLQAGSRPGQVSGGQAQRISLCRALLMDPLVLLADEPTGNLDPASADVVVEAFNEQASRGSTVIVVTHDPALVARCDRSISL